MTNKVSKKLTIFAAVLGAVGAAMVTGAAFSPYNHKSAAFAAFCWVVDVSFIWYALHLNKANRYK